MRFNNFFLNFNVINQNQFGFQSRKCTEHAIIRLLDTLYESINKNQFAIEVCVDYKRAFDTINHNILIKKLELLGIRGRTLYLIRSFLYNRTYKVRINSSTSGELNCNVVLPQGSILSPLLFLAFINDIFSFSMTHR